MSKRNIEAIYPLSPMQQGMLFHTLYAPESNAYFEQLTCTLRGDLHLEAFQKAWQTVVNRNSVLRTTFVWKNPEKMLQAVLRGVELPVVYQDWRGISEGEQEARLQAYLQADRKLGFDLAKAPLIRLALFQTQPQTYRLVWSHHHILMDGWSLPLILREVMSLYEGYRQGKEVYLKPTRPYREYIAWLQKQAPAQAEDYWKRYLAGFHAPTPLIVDEHRALAKGEQGRNAEATFELAKETTAALQALARNNRFTLSTLLQGAWGLLLSRYSGEDEIVFGATVSGRPPELPGVEEMIGIFINSLPVRVRVQPDRPAVEWLQALQAELVEMHQYEYSSLVQIQEWSSVPRGMPLFETLLVFENYPVNASLRQQSGSLAIDNVLSFEKTNYPLTVISGPGESLPVKISYDPGRFHPETIRRMLGHLGQLLEGIAANPRAALQSLPLLTGAERRQALFDWNSNRKDYRLDMPVHKLVEAAAQRNPDGCAVVYGSEQITYRELDRRVNQVAHFLARQDVTPETMVAISVEPGIEMIVGTLGILKSGGAFVPLDPAYPLDRLSFMLEDTAAPVLLTQKRLLPGLPDFAGRIVCLDGDWDRIAAMPGEAPQVQVEPASLCYVIYTSGSTGKPKGTLLEHHGLCNFTQEFIQATGIQPGDRMLQFASFSFDAAVAEIFVALIAGITLVMGPRETMLSMPDLTRLMREQGVTIATLPPSVLRLLDPGDLPDFKKVLSVAESCSPDIVRRWAQGRRFFNGYGPTETTVGATLFSSEEDPDSLVYVPIGRPDANVQIYLLDRWMQPAPIGVPGEIYIGGAQVARGYLNQPALTAERFIPDPFRSASGDPAFYPGEQPRLYRTGDLGRFRPDGLIEFVGRVDNQVKLRGFRIELGEIENVLSQHPLIQETAVLLKENEAGEKRLAAYLQLKDSASESLDIVALRDHLRERLPAYMVPAAYLVVDTFPRLLNGKIDRRALSRLDGQIQEAGEEHAAPRTWVEEVLAELFARVLNLKQVGREDNFFDLGGHSLLATQLTSRLREAFGVDLPIRALFENPTVAGLGQQVELALRSSGGVEAPPITPQPVAGDLQLSFAQQRLWFLDQLSPGNLFYNIPTAVRLQGELDVPALEQSLNAIVRRHEVLRTTFTVSVGTPVQVILPELRIPLPVDDLSTLPEAEKEAEAKQRALLEVRQPFDLGRGPLLRARLLKLDAQDFIAVLTVHHIAADGWSLNVLIQELTALYRAFHLGQEPLLPALAIQYRDFAIWQRGWLQGETLNRQLAYWKDQLLGRTRMLDLPADHPRPAVQSSQGATAYFHLPVELSDRLRRLSRMEGATLFMTLLAAFQAQLHRYSGQEDILVGSPVANRNRAEIEPLIGFFVNTLVLRASFTPGLTFKDLLKQVRETTLGAYVHQDLPFEMLVDALQPERDLSHTPLFQVAFTLQNPPAAPVELPGVTLSGMPVDSGTAKFDLTLTLSDSPDGLAGAFEYNSDLFEPETISRMAGHLQTLLESVVADPAQPVDALEMLTEAERRQLIVEWNRTAAPAPLDRCAHELFATHAARQPETQALAFEGASLTYGELDRRSNQLAHYLRKQGAGAGTLIGISTERSLEMIVGILGILKAGAAYLPLDPNYPAERLEFMLVDSRAPFLLTQERILARLPVEQAGQATGAPVRVICLDAGWSEITREPVTAPEVGTGPDDLAYVIYTSGSTGKPKGALLRHKGLCNLAEAQRAAFGIGSKSRVLQFSPFSFDASVWETFMALANGAVLVLAKQETLASGPELLKLLHRERVTTVTLPPSVLTVLEPDDLPDLATVIAAGEACPRDLVRRWAPGRRFFNAYGPTETTVCASMFLCSPDDPHDPPIGRPLANARLYILDASCRPTPVGVPGELMVSGPSLARGYLNRPELTAEKFIPNPFQAEDPRQPGDPDLPEGLKGEYGRLYRTGDLVRYLPDGNIEFLGRIDNQVKVRGFRIELGEIETCLRAHPAVRDAVVVAREDPPGDRRLVAYLLREETSEVKAQELRAYVREKLPEYMTPSAFVFLDAFPLSPSGKVDRKALPAPENTRAGLETEYVAPRNDIESSLSQIAGELLGLERVGVYDNFFELGGHSLLATQMISRVREAHHVEIPLRALFEHPTIAELAQSVAVLLPKRQAQAERIAELLKKVDQLSEGELRALLAARKAAGATRQGNG